LKTPAAILRGAPARRTMNTQPAKGTDAPAMPGVSVVIPAYNYARFLGNTIRSVLRQDYHLFEVIVVDDGSTDDTRAVVRAIADERVRYVYQDNAGLSASRNTGVRNARFDYVAFLDADDEWAPGLLETIMAAFAALPPEFAMIASVYARMDADGGNRQNKRFRISTDRELTARDYLMKNPAPLSSSVILKRRVFDECGWFDTALRSSEDRDMWIRVSRRYRTMLLARPLVFIRRHPSNMSKHADRMKANTRRVLNKAREAGVVSKTNLPFWARVLAVYYFETAWTFYDEGRRAAALRYIAASLALWPFWLNAAKLNEPPLFRLRALVHFLLRGRQAGLKTAAA